MKRRLLLGLGIGGMLLTLAACQPKEEPKELAKLAYTNTIKSTGFNMNTSGKFNVDMGSLAEGEIQDLGFNSKMNITYDIKNAIDFKKKQAEQQYSITVPYQKNSYTFKTGLYLDESEKQMTIDNNSLLKIAHTIWEISEAESVTGSLSDEQKKDITAVLDYLDTKLTNTNTFIGTEDLYTSSPTKEIKKGASRLIKLLNWIPEDAYSYAKDKKGQYGHILVSLTDAQVKAVIESSIKDAYKVDKKLGDVKQQEQFLKEQLSTFKDEQKTMKFTKAHLTLLVNENKQLVDASLVINLEVTPEGAKKKDATYAIINNTSFTHYNKPSFTLPIKENKDLSMEEVTTILNSKMNDLSRKYTETVN
ncbi:hypothetical protein CN918_25770 [Priestia megaterium]|nr:hypothetical protein CN918_25770 [Priestia megaterium]